MHHKENIGHKAKTYTLQIFRFCLNILGEVITKTAATELLKLEPPSSKHTQARVSSIPLLTPRCPSLSPDQLTRENHLKRSRTVASLRRDGSSSRSHS